MLFRTIFWAFGISLVATYFLYREIVIIRLVRETRPHEIQSTESLSSSPNVSWDESFGDLENKTDVVVVPAVTVPKLSVNVTLPKLLFPRDSSVVDSLFQRSLPGCPLCPTGTKKKIEWNRWVESVERLLQRNTTALMRHRNHSAPRGPESSWLDLVDEGTLQLLRNALIQKDYPTVMNCHSVFLGVSCKSLMIHDKNQAFSAMPQNGRGIVDLTRMDSKEHPIIAIYQTFGNNYYHSLVECLPRLALFLDYLRENPQATILAGNQFLARQSRTWNRLLGNLTNSWIPYNPQKTYMVPMLIVPPFTHCGSMDPVAALVLSQQFEKSIPHLLHESPTTTSSSTNKDEDALPSRRKIPLVVLQKRSKRGIINHDQLEEALRETCRKSNACRLHIFHGNESLTETAILHHQADVVVGPHGAGLANLIFCRYGSAALVEFTQTYGRVWEKKRHNPCHQNTAMAMNLRSVLLIQTDGSYFTEFTVNVTQAVEAVMDMLPSLS